AENDWARNSLFATARGISLFGSRKRKEQAKLLGHALGSYGPQITDSLELRDPKLKGRAQEKILAALDRDQTALLGGDSQLLAGLFRSRMQAETFEITRENVELLRLGSKQGTEGMPARVTRVSKDIISGHSDFFRVGFVSWLASYVLDLQRRNLA